MFTRHCRNPLNIKNQLELLSSCELAIITDYLILPITLMAVGGNAYEHSRDFHYGNDDKIVQERFSEAFQAPFVVHKVCTFCRKVNSTKNRHL